MKKLVCFLSIVVAITLILIIINIITTPATYSITNWFDWLLNTEENILCYINLFFLAFWYLFVLPIYLLQVIVVIFGLFFRLFKQKQTVKCLLVPFGFLLLLSNIYKGLK